MIKHSSHENLGTFTLPEGSDIRVTDPCYNKATWCAGTVKAKPGVWHARAYFSDEGDWGVRVSALEIVHESRLDEARVTETLIGGFHQSSIDVGVDSGQAGFFVDAMYPDGDTGEYGEMDTFYGRACDTSIDDRGRGRAGMMPSGEGVVSSSGFGDGGYRLMLDVPEGREATQMVVVFIGDDEDED